MPLYLLLLFVDDVGVVFTSDISVFVSPDVEGITVVGIVVVCFLTFIDSVVGVGAVAVVVSYLYHIISNLIKNNFI